MKCATLNTKQAMNRFFVIIYIFFLFTFKIYAQDIYNHENTLKFADYLYASGDFKEAALEYERALFFDSLSTENQFKLIRSYRKSGSPGEAIKKYGIFCKSVTCPPILTIEHAKALSDLAEYQKCLEYIEKHPDNNNPELAFVSVTCMLKLSQWDDAKNLITAMPENNAMNMFAPIIHNAKNNKMKSPLVASLLSTAVPGLGKVYTGYWKDGLIAFVLIGTSAFQAYRGFNQKGVSSAYGWIFSLTFTGFYIGNIYGSAKSANKRNVLINQSIQNEVDMVYRLYD